MCRSSPSRALSSATSRGGSRRSSSAASAGSFPASSCDFNPAGHTTNAEGGRACRHSCSGGALRGGRTSEEVAGRDVVEVPSNGPGRPAAIELREWLGLLDLLHPQLLSPQVGPALPHTPLERDKARLA